MKDDVTFSYGEGRLTAHIKCDIDHHTARRMRERIDRELFEKRPEVLILDFSSVEFMDSSGLGLVLGRVEKASALGAMVRLCGLSPTLMKLVRLSGLEKVRGLSVIK